MYGRHAPATCRWQWYISDQNTVTKYQPLQSALPDTLCFTFLVHVMDEFRNYLFLPTNIINRLSLKKFALLRLLSDVSQDSTVYI